MGLPYFNLSIKSIWRIYYYFNTGGFEENIQNCEEKGIYYFENNIGRQMDIKLFSNLRL
jgi:hypothetical protein